MRFYSDNTATAAPEILAAIAEANQGHTIAYGDDPWTQRLDAVLSEFFGTQVRSFAVTTGTAANSLSLATLSPPWGAIYVHEEGHIGVDECGAPQFFTGGAQLVSLPGKDGKLTPEVIRKAIDKHPANVHTVQPAVVSLTQATELGTVYRPDEVATISNLAHERGLAVQMDGARFANALAFLDCHPGDVTWRAGVDVLSFGATKNGALAAEAVVFFNPERVRDFEFRRKRAGHHISKSRFVTAQLLAYVETGVWQRNARRANSFARRIGRAAGSILMYPIEANEVFVRLGEERKAQLRAAGFGFYDWGPALSGEARFVASWDQREDDVESLCKALGG